MVPPTPLPGRRVRGSDTGRPIMALLDLLGRRWALRVIWDVAGMAAKYRSGGAMADRWHEHRRFTSSRQLRLWFGTTNADSDDWPITQPGVRADCFSAINGTAIGLEVDLSFWMDPSQKAQWRDVAQSAYETVFALAKAHQALLYHVLGHGMYPLPPI